MAARQSQRKADVAADAWRALLHCFLQNRDRHVALAASFGLTAGDMKTLLSLDPEQSKPMRALAQERRCDASNVTWLVDRLEMRGLVERRTLPADRRVKTVAITPAGAQLRAELLERMYEPPEALVSLPRADLDALVHALGKLASS